jgi:hypothetical protein
MVPHIPGQLAVAQSDAPDIPADNKLAASQSVAAHQAQSDVQYVPAELRPISLMAAMAPHTQDQQEESVALSDEKEIPAVCK